MRIADVVKKISVKKLRRYYTLYIERSIFYDKFNIFATIYLNFRLLSIKNAIKIPIFVYGHPKFWSLYGNVEFVNCKVKPGLVKLNWTKHTAGGPNNSGCPTELNIWGTIIFKGTCRIGSSNKICVGEHGILELGKECHIMTQCNITAYSSVVIGNNFLMAHRSQILDTNYHFVADLVNKRVKRHFNPIKIGNDCWLCNSSTIAGGAVLPNNTIVASNSLINKDMANIPEYSIVGGLPAKLIATGYMRIYNQELERRIYHFFYNNIDNKYYIYK